MDTVSETIESPFGLLELCANDHGLVSVRFLRKKRRKVPHTAGGSGRRHQIIQESAKLFERYFRGDYAALSRVKLDLQGTPFQVKVWQAAKRIRPSRYRCYSDVARWVGRPKASRAVGQALRVNPLAIVIPCHRVVGKDGALTGYNGGIPTKRTLLQHEGVALAAGSRS